jgi:uncharacterized peroxidase-related enzyme
MPRVREIDLSTLPKAIRSTLKKRQTAVGGDPTWQLVMAHRPRQLGHVLDLMDSFAEDGVVPRRLRELAVVTVSKANECAHCVGRHSVRLNDVGMSYATIDGLLDPDCPGLDRQERLVRDYALAVTSDANRIRDAMFDDLHAAFDEEVIVELTLLITIAGFFNAFNNAMQVTLDEAHSAMQQRQRAAGIGASAE